MLVPVCFLGAVIYVCLAVYFEFHFFFNCQINGVSVSGQNIDVAEDRIKEAIQTYELSIEEMDGSVEIIPAMQLGMKENSAAKEIEKLLSAQNGFCWGYYAVVGLHHASDQIVTYDEEKISDRLQTLHCMNKTNQIKSTNATIAYEGGKFVTVPESYGTEVDEQELKKKLCKKIILLDENYVLKDEGGYKQPVYKESSPEMKEIVSKCNRYVSTDITYRIGEDTEKIPRDTIGEWILLGENNEIVFDEEAMKSFLTEMGKKYNTYGESKFLKTQYGVKVEIPCGNLGWLIDKTAEIEQLKSDICRGEKVDRDFIYKYTAVVHGENDFGTSYIEVNKATQQLFLLIDGEVIYETPVVTGKETPECSTPIGAYQITYKEKNAILRGDDYETPVQYWMPFCGNVGLHDAIWQDKFGENRYLQGYGSHGCINLPLESAEIIYPYVEKGFPVLIYDLPGVECTKDCTQ